MPLEELSDDHDLDHLRTALKYVKKFDVAVDAGANRGIWSREMAKHFQTVHAFEAQSHNYKRLIEDSRDYPNIDAKWMALGDKRETVGIAPGTENVGQWHVSPEWKELVVMVPLDEYPWRVDFLKIDVEGYEPLVLTGGMKTILRDKPVILLEDNGLCERYGFHHGACGDMLETIGYKLMDRGNWDFIYACM